MTKIQNGRRRAAPAVIPTEVETVYVKLRIKSYFRVFNIGVLTGICVDC